MHFFAFLIWPNWCASTVKIPVWLGYSNPIILDIDLLRCYLFNKLEAQFEHSPDLCRANMWSRQNAFALIFLHVFFAECVTD